jgi:hypothetical protein
MGVNEQNKFVLALRFHAAPVAGGEIKGDSTNV